MNTIITKAVSSGDFTTISALAHEIWNEHYAGLLSQEQIDYMLQLNQTPEAVALQVAGETVYYIACKDGEPAGYFAVKPDGGNLFISKLYIRREFRGMGIGRAFLSRAAADFPNAKTMRLFVNKHNSSVNAYLKMGFKINRSMITDIGDGFVMDDYEMVLIIEAN